MTGVATRTPSEVGVISPRQCNAYTMKAASTTRPTPDGAPDYSRRLSRKRYLSEGRGVAAGRCHHRHSTDQLPSRGAVEDTTLRSR